MAAALDVVGYSTPESVYEEALEPAFEKTPDGTGVSFSNSFGASGDQSRAVVAGQPASVVHFAQAGDMERLVEEGGLVAKDWDKQPYNGIAQDSVVVITVRKGNPEGIESLDDVLTKDVEVVTPNPFSSGAARWNIMAVYGTADQRRASRPTRRSTPSRPCSKRRSSSRAAPATRSPPSPRARATCCSATRTRRSRRSTRAKTSNTSIPPSTILIETPIAVTKDAPEPAAQDFLDYIWSDAGQEIWAENGYRPVNPKLVDPKQFPTPKDLFKISQFGGWSKVNDEFFDDETGSVAKIEEELGVSTSADGGTPGNSNIHPQHPGQASACPGPASASARAWSCST